MIKLYRYRLPLKKAFITGGRIWHFREGIIIRYFDEDTDLAAEIAPLPGFSAESTGDALNALVTNHSSLNDLLSTVSEPEDLKQLLDQKNYPPSVEFGISCIGLDLINSRNTGSGNKNFIREADSLINVNGVVGIGSKTEITDSIRNLYLDGYRTVKLKCGHDPSMASEIIMETVDEYPDLKFRLDPNRSWPVKDTPGILERFSNLPIEYCEEPSPFKNVSEAAALKKMSPIPIALDESVENIKTLGEIIKLQATDVVIIKPMIMGSLLKLIETFIPLPTHFIDRVCTTSLESGVGRHSVAKISTLIGSDQFAQGLDTGRLMDGDISSEYIENGSLYVNADSSWSTSFSRCDTNNLAEVDI